MSWPDDGLPRFKVAVLEGGYGDDGNPVRSDRAYVYDRGRRHRTMAVYRGGRALARAETAAARLERLTAGEPPKEIPPGSKLRHGTYSCYVNLKCRCWDCAEYTRSVSRAWSARKQAQTTKGTEA